MEAIRSTIAENLTGGNKVVKDEFKFTPADVPSQSGKVAVITGASEGIGYGIAYHLLSHDIAKVFILSTSENVVDEALASIKEELGQDVVNRVQWVQVDLSDNDSVRKAAKQVLDKTDRIDILANIAARGIMAKDTTSDGIERSFAVNHVGHVVLTSELLPTLKKTAEKDTVRIVNMASNLHESVPKVVKFESVEELNETTDPQELYGRTKLCSILYSKYLNRHVTSKYPNLLANATHPGIVETRQTSEHILDAYPVMGYGMKYGLAPFKKDIFEGALSATYAATKTDGSGQYICPPAKVERGSDLANDDALGEQLMKLTREIVAKKGGQQLQDY